MPSCHRVPVCPMTGESANSQKMLLAAAIAEGTAVAKWASSNEVPERTAYRWAAEPEVRSEIESIRRRALDEAIGRLAKRATWAVDGIVDARRERRFRISPAVGASSRDVRLHRCLQFRGTRSARGRAGGAVPCAH